MLIKLTAISVVLFVIRISDCQNELKSSLHAFPNFLVAPSAFYRSNRALDTHSALPLNNLQNVHNGTALIVSPRKLTPYQVRLLFEENEKKLSKALKKSRWKQKAKTKVASKTKEKLTKEEEKLRQLNELYDLQNPQTEFQDEEHDAEIFKAIYDSVMFHRKTWVKKLFDKFTNKRHRVKRDEEVVCYKDLGCFRDEGPFDYFDMLPNSPEEVNTQFLVHSKENPTREQYIFYQNASSILNSNFRANRKTKVIIHGFGSSCHRVWVREMRNTFLKMEDVNVICVHWEDGSSTPNYVRAASNTRLVGSQVAVMLEKLRSVTNMSLEDVHLVGFSLGAHVSGYAGQRLKGMIGRISGLDPAGPLFESFSPNMRLDATDANFVDVIHTNADSILRGGLGAYDPMGHVDFYPNGGKVQKGCKNLFVGGVSDILWPKEGDGRYLCNHRRGYKYFIDSAVPVCQFPAFACHDYDSFLTGDCFPCKECGNMGFYADKAPGRGQLFLVTRDEHPFCANQFKIEIWHSGGPPATEPVATQGSFEVTFVTQDGKNETIDITRDNSNKIEAGSRTVIIIVLHVALSVIANVQVTYTSRTGWLSSGYNRWAIDKLSLMSSLGNVQSFCHRGLTMESGLSMLFPLVQGDCDPRDLTLHPLPVPGPGIEYNLQNGVHIFPYSSTSDPVANEDHFRHNFTRRPQIQPHPVETRRPEDQIETSTLSSTFSVIYSLPEGISNVTKLEPLPLLNKTTMEAVEQSDSQTSMSTEEYLAWKKAPPPNLHKSDNSGVVVTPLLPQNGMNHIPSIVEEVEPNIDEIYSTTEPSLIREDAQVTDMNERNSEAQKIGYTLPREEYIFNTNTNLFGGENGFADLLKNGFKISLNKKPVSEVPTNSVVEGEVPFKERARAIKFESPNNKTPQNDPQKTHFKTDTRAKDSELPQHQNFANYQQDTESKSTFNEDVSEFNFNGGSRPQHSFEDDLHTFPPTVLKPPRNKVSFIQRNAPNPTSFRQHHRISPHRNPHYFRRHRYYPRQPVGFRAFEYHPDYYPSENNSPDSLRALPSYHVPSFTPSRRPTPFSRPFQNHSFRPFSKRSPPPSSHERGRFLHSSTKIQNSESRLPKLLPFLSQRFSAVPAFKRFSGHLKHTVSQAPNLPHSISRIGKSNEIGVSQGSDQSPSNSRTGRSNLKSEDYSFHPSPSLNTKAGYSSYNVVPLNFYSDRSINNNNNAESNFNILMSPKSDNANYQNGKLSKVVTFKLSEDNLRTSSNADEAVDQHKITRQPKIFPSPRAMPIGLSSKPIRL